MTLSLYVARRLLTTFLAVLAAFGLLMLLLDLIEELHRAAGKPISFLQALGLAALNIPEGLYRILPLIMMLASVVLFVGLARTSEMVIIRASGRSALRSLVAPVLTAIGVGAFAVAVLNPLVAATSQAYRNLQNHYSIRAADNVMSIGRDGLWLRQGGPEGQTVIRAQHASLDGTQLSNATFIRFASDGSPLMRIEAASAQLTPGAWKLTDAKIWRLSSANPEVSAVARPAMTLPSDLTRTRIRDSFGNPGQIPIWQLPAYIDQLRRAGFSVREHQVWLQVELALPALMAAMVLIAAGFTMRHSRFGRTGMMVLFAVIAGFAVFFLRNFAEVLGNTGRIPVALAAWGPPATGILLSLGLLLHLEDG